MNKVDLVCGDCFEEEERLDPDGVVNIVHNCICKICGCSSEEVPKEVVIPISGKWAYLARAFLKNPSDAKRKKAVIRVLADHSNQPAGQGESLESVFARKTDTQLTSELEGLSNIRGLEKRYTLTHARTHTHRHRSSAPLTLHQWLMYFSFCVVEGCKMSQDHVLMYG